MLRRDGAGEASLPARRPTEDETSAGGRQTRQELASNSCGRLALAQAPLDQAGFPPPIYPMGDGENLSGLASLLDTSTA